MAARPTFHLTYRLGIRFAQFASVGGAATPGAGIWRTALPFFVVADIAIWLVLRTTDKFGLAWRLALDTLDIAFWSLSPLPPSGSGGIAVQVVVPLTVEAGFRCGSWAFVVPATEIAATEIATALWGRPPALFNFVPPIIGVVMGMALFTYCRHLYQQSEIERTLRLSADEKRAFLAGQNAVAMGASSVVDVIEGLVPILGRPPPGSALWEVADGWKTRLGDLTSRQATYLQVALLEWERRHNLHPDLASHVRMFVSQGAGTTLLTGPQVTWLAQTLDRLELRGPVWAVPSGADNHLRPPGAALLIQVGAQLIVVPADTHTNLRRVDGSLVGYLMIATIIPFMTIRSGTAVPWTAAFAGIALSLGAGWWSHRQLRARGGVARRVNLRCAIVVALALTAFFSLSMGRSISADGDLNVIGVGLPLLAIIGGAYCRSSRKLFTESLMGVVAVCGLSVLLYPGAVTLRAIALLIDWNLLLFFPVWERIGWALDQAQENHANDAERADSETIRAAFQRGQQEVVSLVRRARDDAQRQLAALIPVLEGADADLAYRRLHEVDQRLEMIDRLAGLRPVSGLQGR